LIQYIDTLDDKKRDFNINDILKQYLYGKLDNETANENIPKNDYVYKTVSSG
jgi:hypothetical protein